jgi:hypothetical protein
MQFELTKNEPDDGLETEWVKWYDDVKKVGDRFTIKADKVIFKEESQPVFFVIDEDSNKGISVFAAHHPNAKFTDSTPHGIRLANAIGRAFAITGEVSGEELAEYVTEHPDALLVVEKTDKGVLWSIGLKGATTAKK